MHEAAGAARACLLRRGETLDSCFARSGRCSSIRAVDPMVTSKTPGDGAGHPRGQREQPVRRRHDWRISSGFEEAYPLELAPGEAGRPLVEEVYRVGGRYAPYIERIVRATSRPRCRTRHRAMGRALEALVRFYRTGRHGRPRARTTSRGSRTATRPWTRSTASSRCTWTRAAARARGKALVYYVHPEKTAAIARIAEHAQWFEDRMPWDPRYRKPQVTGVTARAIDVVIETGDSGPVTPIGINLPNDQEIRETHGSKSVSLSNVLEAYEKSTPRAFRDRVQLGRGGGRAGDALGRVRRAS